MRLAYQTIGFSTATLALPLFQYVWFRILSPADNTLRPAYPTPPSPTLPYPCCSDRKEQLKARLPLIDRLILPYCRNPLLHACWANSLVSLAAPGGNCRRKLVNTYIHRSALLHHRNEGLVCTLKDLRMFHRNACHTILVRETRKKPLKAIIHTSLA